MYYDNIYIFNVSKATGIIRWYHLAKELGHLGLLHENNSRTNLSFPLSNV